MKWKIGRNDPCPCGSGKKYKKCCLGKSVTSDCTEIDEAELEMFSEMELSRASSMNSFLDLLDCSPSGVIQCSSEDEADELVFKLSLEGKRAMGCCKEGVYSVVVFDQG